MWRHSGGVAPLQKSTFLLAPQRHSRPPYGDCNRHVAIEYRHGGTTDHSLDISATLMDGATRHMAPHDYKCFLIAEKLFLTVRAKVVVYITPTALFLEQYHPRSSREIWLNMK
eukprot:sb/3476965/